MPTILLLLISNIFMTLAWYGHLKFPHLPMVTAVLIGGGIALIEYSFAVPANLAHTVMDSLIKNGKVSRGFLGIALQPLTDDLAKAFKIENNAGALVAEVTAKSPAEKAGLRSGDILESIAGFTTREMSVGQAKNLLTGQVGTGVKVGVIRRGKTQPEDVDIVRQKLAPNCTSPACQSSCWND